MQTGKYSNGLSKVHNQQTAPTSCRKFMTDCHESIIFSISPLISHMKSRSSNTKKRYTIFDGRLSFSGACGRCTNGAPWIIVRLLFTPSLQVGALRSVFMRIRGFRIGDPWAVGRLFLLLTGLCYRKDVRAQIINV